MIQWHPSPALPPNDRENSREGAWGIPSGFLGTFCPYKKYPRGTGARSPRDHHNSNNERRPL